MKPVILIITSLMCNGVFGKITDRPIIGILSQEFKEEEALKYLPDTNYIAASYVKAVEAAGARVVPILVRKNLTYYKQLLRSINGVVIPGGKAHFEPKHPHYDAFIIIYRLAKQMNDEGIFFPILGICRGYEALLVLTNNHVDMQYRCDILHHNFPLTFTKNFRQTLTFASLPEEIYIYLKYFDVTKNNHNWCTSLQNFTKYGLDKEWQITTTNVDFHGLEFISSMEHKRYPFVGLQYHPEKLFEWNPALNNPHSRTAIRANRYFYDLFVNLSKMNGNAFLKEKDERKALIYNYSPRMCDPGDDFDQIYVFP